MAIGITGIRGLIGARVAEMAREAGSEVVGFSRGGGCDRMFSSERAPDFCGIDAVIHFAGEPVMGIWTRAKREKILESRVLGTRRVVEGIARSANGPKILVCASAIGFYGDTGEDEVSESSPSGVSFLAEVARAWEAEAQAAEKLGVRVVRLRIGFVLAQGGAMGLIAPIFRLGLGGRLGSGNQWMSLIHLNDVAAMALWSVQNPAISGAVNAVMPRAVRNRDFTKALAKALGRPAIFPVPAPVLRLALGGLSSLMLDSVRVRPVAALSGGFEFRHPALPGALDACLK